MSHESIKAIAEAYKNMLNEARGNKVVFKVAGRNSRDFEKQLRSIDGYLENLVQDGEIRSPIEDIGVDKKGNGYVVLADYGDAQEVESELTQNDDLVDPKSVKIQ